MAPPSGCIPVVALFAVSSEIHLVLGEFHCQCFQSVCPNNARVPFSILGSGDSPPSSR